MFSSTTRETQSYEELKRRIYLTIIPILILALSVGWLLTDYVLEKFAYPPLATLLILICLFLFKNMNIRISEIIMLSLFTLFHVIRVCLIATLVSKATFDVYMFWSPLYFVFVFLILGGKRALIFSLSVYITTLSIVSVNALGLPYSYRLSATIIQFFLANLIFIILLYFLHQLVSAYMEAYLLKKIAYQDALTKIWNRRWLDEWIKKEIKSCQETNSNFSIIYFDIDHFKQINDTYGHEVGDNVLKEVATIVQSNLRDTDYFGRWGGEEFLICTAADHASKQATLLAERLRKIIEQHSFLEAGHVTASFGITSLAKEDDLRMILWRADLALYEAKQSGRNTVKVHLA
jgi:diguanylate cyclase (GGDEF)-like protein